MSGQQQDKSFMGMPVRSAFFQRRQLSRSSDRRASNVCGTISIASMGPVSSEPTMLRDGPAFSGDAGDAGDARLLWLAT
jgi:hypothetical protein